MITEKQFEEFIKKLKEEIDYAQEDFANLDWIDKEHAIKIINKLSKDLKSIHLQQDKKEGFVIEEEDTQNDLCECGHDKELHRPDCEGSRKGDMTKLCKCKKFKPQGTKKGERK